MVGKSPHPQVFRLSLASRPLAEGRLSGLVLVLA